MSAGPSRRGAGSASPDRTPAGGRYGSRSRRRTSAAAQRPASRPPRWRDPGAATRLRGRAGGAGRRSGTAPRAPRAGRTRAPVRSAPARCGRRQRTTRSSSRRRRLYSGPSEPYEPRPSAATTRWHGHDQREPVRRAHRPNRALCVRMPGQRRDLAVRRRLPVRDRAHRLHDPPLELRAPGEIELDVLEGVARAREVRAHALDERVVAGRRPPRTGTRARRAPGRRATAPLRPSRRPRRRPARPCPGIVESPR